ncbi:hypothetical protein Jann_0962 [Jannaschia sp. CCS1]|nr:hypothetical protein Jann_0962 [Jannaschia sp. CCS1]
MVNETNNFNDRLDRIQQRRSGKRGGMGFVVHPDGVVTAIGDPASRLRFGFPLKGLLIALVIAVAVKAYLMWFLGTDLYTLQVQSLLSGTAFEQTAGMILMPDTLSAWTMARIDEIYIAFQTRIVTAEG